jgi:hypothetical protein
MNQNNKKRTAVETMAFLLELEIGDFVPDQKLERIHKIISHAKALEKEQIVDAYLTPLSNEYWFQKDEILNQESEKYYNETYGGDE